LSPVEQVSDDYISRCIEIETRHQLLYNFKIGFITVIGVSCRPCAAALGIANEKVLTINKKKLEFVPTRFNRNWLFEIVLYVPPFKNMNVSTEKIFLKYSYKQKMLLSELFII